MCVCVGSACACCMRVCTSLKAAFSLSARLDSTICAVYVSVFTVCSPCASERARISTGRHEGAAAVRLLRIATTYCYDVLLLRAASTYCRSVLPGSGASACG